MFWDAHARLAVAEKPAGARRNRPSRCKSLAIGAIFAPLGRLLTMASLLLGLAAFLQDSVAAAEPTAYTFSRELPADFSGRRRTLVKIEGKLRLSPGDKVFEIPFAAGVDSYDSFRVLDRERRQQLGLALVRRYHQVEGSLQVGQQDPQSVGVRAGVTFVGVRPDGTTIGLRGPLTNEEVDRLDPLGGRIGCLTRLLPREPNSPAGTWEPQLDEVAAWLGLDTVTQGEVRGELIAVEQQRAKMKLTGTVSGRASGATTRIELTADLDYDLQAQRIASVSLAWSENRDIGVAQPGFSVKGTTQLTISADDAPHAALADAQVEQIDAKAIEQGAKQWILWPNQNWAFTGSRQWHAVVQTQAAVTLRRVELGDLVAQCNLTLPTEESLPRSLKAYEREVRTALGDNFGEVVDSRGWEQEGRRCYRVAVAGAVKDVPVQWRHYLVWDPQREQAVSLIFTIPNEMAETLGREDLDLVQSLQWVPPVAEAAGDRPARR